MGNFSKNDCLPNERKIHVFFLVLPSTRDIREQFIRLHRKFLQSFCKFQDHLCNIQGIVEKTQISKKCWLSMKNLLAFFRIIEHEKQQGTLYRSPEGNLTNIVQVRRPFR